MIKVDFTSSNLNPFYIVPYILTIVLAIVSVILWYFKLVVRDSLATSYNAEIRADGQKELFNEVYKDYASSISSPDESSSIADDNKSVHHAEFLSTGNKKHDNNTPVV